MVQWLGLCVFTAEGAGLIPGQGTKIPPAAQHSQKNPQNPKANKQKTLKNCPSWRKPEKPSPHPGSPLDIPTWSLPSLCCPLWPPPPAALTKLCLPCSLGEGCPLHPAAHGQPEGSVQVFVSCGFPQGPALGTGPPNTPGGHLKAESPVRSHQMGAMDARKLAPKARQPTASGPMVDHLLFFNRVRRAIKVTGQLS